MTDEPTLSEVMRRLDETSRQIADLAAQMREDHRHAAQTYVRQDVYLAQRQADQAVMADQAGDVKAVEVKVDALAAKVDSNEDKRRNSVRWGIGTSLVCLGLLLTLASIIVSRS